MQQPLLPSPLQEIFPENSAGVRVFLKRDDLIHPEIQGNKWRKLRPFLQTSSEGLFSFGGAFSNHLHALAAAGRLLGIPTAALIRGKYVNLENPTLAFAQQCGMQLYPVAKSDYDRLKKAALPEIFHFLKIKPDHQYQLVPEGGDTPEALYSCLEIVQEIKAQLPVAPGQPVYIAVPAGTGCTAAAIVAGAADDAQVLVFPAAPYGVDYAVIRQKLHAAGIDQAANFHLFYSRLKFAAMPPELLLFIRQFYEKHQVLLDPIYTSKMMYRLKEMLELGFFPQNSVVVAIHTGGLQGWQCQSGNPDV